MGTIHPCHLETKLILGVSERGSRQTRSHNPVLQYYTHTVQQNVLQIWRELRSVCEENDVDFSNYKDDFSILSEFKHREKLSAKVVSSLQSIARSNLLEECQKKKRILQLPYNYKYFVQHTDRILADGFVPNEVDIIYSYTPTIGLDEHMMHLGKQLYGIQELPGHHIFRRRWKDFFRYTSVIVFLIDLCELCDGAFYTGHLKNKTIAIFEELVKNEYLKNTGFILLFNKKDVFDEQSRRFDFKQLALHVRSAEEAITFYRTMFTAVSPPKRSYHHIVSLVNAPNLGNIVTESLNRIFQYNTRIITSA